MILRWTERAAEHLESMYEFIAGDSARASDALLEHTIDAAEKLTRFPELERKGRVPGTRELILPGTPIILAYRIHKNAVEILAVLHVSRKWPDSF